MEAQLAKVLAELQEIKARLGLNSTTSHQPPSQDKPWTPKSERQKTGRSSGAQPGHPGKTLKIVEHPDEIVTLPVTGHCGCGQAWDTVIVSDELARQVLDLPEIRLHAVEYRAQVKVCPSCHHREQASFQLTFLVKCSMAPHPWTGGLPQRGALRSAQTYSKHSGSRLWSKAQ
ncbi:DUF6444 domain-containing protein [Deinococcus sp. QL22]|uniref:DUF6444 domain-containing protein n=1 Tax=Deinococcus sp. QL22 TaxID=2939437 RepID=UPI00201770D9|nr:DUF6444 domain-containing protein [Deinococcus sp. QL22]UQN07948.1 DUF6444 domain-containing protein [Deinococcus sp. QL22]